MSDSIYKNYYSNFSTQYKKRVFLFQKFKNRFKENEFFYVYLQGILNSHLDFNSIRPNFPGILELHALMKNDATYFSSQLPQKKWINYFSFYVLNQILKKFKKYKREYFSLKNLVKSLNLKKGRIFFKLYNWKK